MSKKLVLTLTGRDRVGLVEQVTKKVLKYNGNIEASRMARLGGEFTMLMLVSTSESKFEELKQGVHHLEEEGFTVTTCPTEQDDSTKYTGWLPYLVEVTGADHEGIIHNIARHLAEHDINIETMDTNMVKAPVSGTPLFMMEATVLVPPNLTYHALEEDLDSVGNNLNVDINVTPYTGQGEKGI